MEKRAEWPARGGAAVPPFPGDILEPSRVLTNMSYILVCNLNYGCLQHMNDWTHLSSLSCKVCVTKPDCASSATRTPPCCPVKRAKSRKARKEGSRRTNCILHPNLSEGGSPNTEGCLLILNLTQHLTFSNDMWEPCG